MIIYKTNTYTHDKGKMRLMGNGKWIFKKNYKYACTQKIKIYLCKLLCF